jgi:Spy/CpxP family protein refolding chaperone
MIKPTVMKQLIIIILAIPMFSFSQNRQGSRGERFEKIQTAKIGLITENLNLTTEQAPQFWSVYNEYQGKKFDLRRSIKNTLDETNGTTDDKILASQRQALAIRKKEIELDEEYMAKLLKIITPKQYAELKRTEQSFNRKLLEKLRE